jgi:hypothetical protein
MNKYDKNQLRILLYRSLSHGSRNPPQTHGTTINSNEDILEQIDYKLNEHGYRSKEFEKDNEILVLGCSQTYGSGMPEELTWPDIFSKSIGKKYSRLAMPGDSINGQVYKAFKYFEEIGNPEIVVGLFPLYRLEYSAIPGKFFSESSWGQAEMHEVSIGMAFFYEEYLTKLSQYPHDPEYVMPKEFSIFYNFMFIKMLEQYCESHNIKFIWSIYEDEDIIDIMQSTMYITKNYLKTSDIKDSSKYKQDEHKECGLDFIGHKLFKWGADFDKKRNMGHWGIHTHQHMSELFINRYRETEND